MRTLLLERGTLRNLTEHSICQEIERRVPLGRLATMDDIADVFAFLDCGSTAP